MIADGYADGGAQAVLDTARCALSAEGLQELRWECILPPGTARAALPPAATTRPSLRRLSYKVCGEPEPLQYLLQSHAATLEAVKVTLRGAGRGVATAMAPLARLPRLTSFALRVEAGDDATMQVVECFLRAASPQLRRVELRVPVRGRGSEEQLVEALGVTGHAAVQSLDLSGPCTSPRAAALSSSLNALLLLVELRLRCVAEPCFLHLLALPGGAAHRLRRLDLAVPPDLCPHLYAHFGEVQVLLRANTLLTVALRPRDPLRWAPRGSCGVCAPCRAGCHAAAWKGGLLHVTGQHHN